MSKGLAFWIIFLVLIILAGFFAWPFTLMRASLALLFLILIALIGWQVFGPPIKG